MANTRHAAVAPIREYQTDGKRKITDKDLMKFTVDGVLIKMAQPKQYDLAVITNSLESGGADDPKNLRIIAQYCSQMVRYMRREPPDKDGNLQGRDWIESRLLDPDDSLDLSFLVPVIVDLLKDWTDRPTGSPRASTAQRRPAPAARVSRARTPSTRAKT